MKRLSYRAYAPDFATDALHVVDVSLLRAACGARVAESALVESPLYGLTLVSDVCPDCLASASL
jgi:hypothetical protein